MNDINLIEEIETNEIISTSDDLTFLNVMTNLYTVSCVLCFLIFIIFLYKYLKSVFPIRRRL